MRHPKYQNLIYSRLEPVRKIEVNDKPEEERNHQEPDSRHQTKYKEDEGRDDQDLEVKDNQDHGPINKQEIALLYQDHCCNIIFKYCMYILTTLPFFTYTFCDSFNYTFPHFSTVIRVTG